MKKIEYKKYNEDKYRIYIEIGSIERDSNILELFDASKTTYNEWYKKFNQEPFGVKITIINYYLLEIEYETPSELTNKIKSNIEIFTNFNNKWFEKDSSLFKGLDLNFNEIEDEISESIQDEEGYEKVIIFKDGSSIKFIDKITNFKSFYILETEYVNFEEQLSKLSKLLK